MYKVFYMECLILTVLLLRVAIVKMNFIFRILSVNGLVKTHFISQRNDTFSYFLCVFWRPVLP